MRIVVSFIKSIPSAERRPHQRESLAVGMGEVAGDARHHCGAIGIAVDYRLLMCSRLPACLPKMRSSSHGCRFPATS